MWYAIADAAALGFELVPHEARDLCAAGEAIRIAAREQLSGDVSIVQLAGPWQGVGAVSRNAVVDRARAGSTGRRRVPGSPRAWRCCTRAG